MVDLVGNDSIVFFLLFVEKFESGYLGVEVVVWEVKRWERVEGVVKEIEEWDGEWAMVFW